MADDIGQIQACIRNRLDRGAIGPKRLAAVIGDSPSRYSKSPALWNAAFEALKIDAVYIAIDVDEVELPSLMAAVRGSDRFLGLQVTVPHKLAVMSYLDEIEADAARIGAVNTVVRTKDGRLFGANTDGEGFVQSLLASPPDQSAALLDSLAGLKTLLVGAGGSARAVAFALAQRVGSGRVVIANRTHATAAALAAEINGSYGNADAVAEETIRRHAPAMDLIVNCSTKGQGGIRKTASGVTFLDRYSALGAAHPREFSAGSETAPDFYQSWLKASLQDIDANNRESMEIARSIPPATLFYDLIYHPEETVFLRHARLTGHRTMNGRGMIVAQAAAGFYDHICRGELERNNLHTPETRRKLAEIMSRAW